MLCFRVDGLDSSTVTELLETGQVRLRAYCGTTLATDPQPLMEGEAEAPSMRGGIEDMELLISIARTLEAGKTLMNGVRGDESVDLTKAIGTADSPQSPCYRALEGGESKQKSETVNNA